MSNSEHAELLPMRDVLRALGVRSRQSVYERLRTDATFPKPRRTGQHTIAWVRSEVDAWIKSLPVAQLDGLDAIERRKAAAAASKR